MTLEQATTREPSAGNQEDFDTALSYLQQALAILRQIQSSQAEQLQEIIAAMERSRQIPDPQLLQDETAQLLARLQELLDGSMERVHLWLNAPHPDLGRRSPLSYLEEGNIQVVEALIWAMETGQPE